MKIKNNFLAGCVCAGALWGALFFSTSVSAASGDSLSTVKEEAQILPMNDGSGKYLLKSDGYYCLDVNGGRSSVPEIHYFDHFEIDGTIFDGYYYHDESGKFKACSSHLENLKNIPVYGSKKQEDNGHFDGYYFVNNLGKLSAAPQVRYIDNLILDKTTFNGFYYFDENGRMNTEPGVYEVEMDCHTQQFDGMYFFGGDMGTLVQEKMVTPQGYLTDETGRVLNYREMGINDLKMRLDELISDYDGNWSVYIKDLDRKEKITINNCSLYSASLIKVFVMAGTYDNLEQVKQNAGKKFNITDPQVISAKVDELLYNMITVSDNESFNELVRLQTDSYDFKKGAEKLNEYIKEEGYDNTTVQHTLHPSSSQKESLGGRNMTSAEDCGILLEKIYKGECVSREASGSMLDLLKNQEVTWKIPEGLPDGIISANKTGETDDQQHDIAIVYGEQTDYIICIMSEKISSEDTAVQNIRDISRIVYQYLNL